MDHSPDAQPRPTVLVIDDGSETATTVSRWLAEDYAVRVVADVDRIAQIAADRVDVLVLDRSAVGDAVEPIRSHSPDVAILALTDDVRDVDHLTAPFDEVLARPVAEAPLRSAVARLDRLGVYWRQCREDYAIAARLAAIESTDWRATPGRLREYADLRHRLTAVRGAMAATSSGLGSRDLARTYAHIDHGGLA